MSGKAPKEDVLELLQDKQWHTTGEMADEMEVSRPTLGNRMKQLAEDGFGILAGHNGYKLMEIEDVTDEEAAREIEQMNQRLIAIVTRQAIVARAMKRLSREASKLLPKTPGERQILRKYLINLTRLIDFIEADEET